MAADTKRSSFCLLILSRVQVFISLWNNICSCISMIDEGIYKKWGAYAVTAINYIVTLQVNYQYQ